MSLSLIFTIVKGFDDFMMQIMSIIVRSNYVHIMAWGMTQRVITLLSMYGHQKQTNTNIIVSTVAARQRRRHTRWGRFPLGRRPPALRKHSFQNKITLQENVSDFLLPVFWVFAPIPATTFSLLTSNERLRRRL